MRCAGATAAPSENPIASTGPVGERRFDGLIEVLVRRGVVRRVGGAVTEDVDRE